MKPELPLVSIVILTSDLLAECTKPCIASIFENTRYQNYEIIIVDDQSTDGTKEFIQSFPEIKLIETNYERFCFARNCNIGIKEAEGDYLCLLNNDTEVRRGWLVELLKLITSNAQYGAVGPKAKWLPVESDPSFLRFFCVLIKKEAYEKVGPLREDFEGYGFDDNDYSKRLKDAGYKLAMHPVELVEHKVSKTFAKKSPDILYNLTGMVAKDSKTAREELLQRNRKIYEHIMHQTVSRVDDERQTFLNLLKTGKYYDLDYYTGKKGYGGYGEHNIYWDGSAGEGMGKAIDELSPATILDVGCATGHVIRLARQRGYQAFGIDISKWACENAPSEIKSYIKQASATNIPFDKEDFDLVWTRDLLQCVEDTLIPRVLSEMSRVCKTEGIIWIASLPSMHRYSKAMKLKFEQKHETHINIQTMEYWINQFKRIDKKVTVWFSLDPDVYNEATLIRYDLNKNTKRKSTKEQIRELIYAATH